jgi:hypothetical protein
MEQITILVQNKKKASFLVELLKMLDFVELVEVSEIDKTNGDGDFFSLAGLWADRDITVEDLRQKAWPRQ